MPLYPAGLSITPSACTSYLPAHDCKIAARLPNLPLIYEERKRKRQKSCALISASADKIVYKKEFHGMKLHRKTGFKNN